jgi:hypothetical protein
MIRALRIQVKRWNPALRIRRCSDASIPQVRIAEKWGRSRRRPRRKAPGRPGARANAASGLLLHQPASRAGVHPYLLNSRFGYVSTFRASHETTIFSDNLAKLCQQLSVDISKTSAQEIGQVTFSAREIGIVMSI